MTKTIFAGALYDLAGDSGLEARVARELELVHICFQREPAFLTLLRCHGIPVTERLEIVDRCFRGQVHAYVMNFLKILVRKGKIAAFPGIVHAYKQRYNQNHGILTATAITAVPMEDDQKERLQAKLSGITGKTILLENRVDPRCLGGMRLEYDNIRIDGTLAHRLESIGRLMRETGGGGAEWNSGLRIL